MKKKFEIKVATQNLFLISSDSDEDLEMILEGHEVKECEVIPSGEHEKGIDEFLCSIALKVELMVLWKECLQFGFS
ncbi:hypothetical protein PVK06_042818 [Gossypium arboreum]|uniref:Uncharacterized protein n=1 Tax=Gossypium arboreum TaxID=29729 RepID=A0ABR0MLT4_GOSAR|nr:hypothetical protein PVK06_042818 [Gossypium arboreum]